MPEEEKKDVVHPPPLEQPLDDLCPFEGGCCNECPALNPSQDQNEIDPDKEDVEEDESDTVN